MPDLLSPLGELRYDPSHSRLLERFIDGALEPRLAPQLLARFATLAGCPAGAVPANLNDTEAERWFATGRVDVAITLPDHFEVDGLLARSAAGDRAYLEP